MTTPELTLDDGVRIPVLGFGVHQIPPEDTERAVSEALELGSRQGPPLASATVADPTTFAISSRRSVDHTL
jgi:hypothetical protein